MAEIKFGKYSQAYYGDVVQADVPRSTGLTLVSTNVYSGKPQAQTDPRMYPAKTEMRLWKDGSPAFGLINNKVYEAGVELSKEQIQAGSNVNYAQFAGELASLGLRTPVGTGGSQFVRDAAAEKKFVETVRANIKAGKPFAEGIAGAGMLGSNVQAKDLAAASDEELIAFVGGVNKEGVIGSGYGINALYDPYASNVPLAKLPGGTGYGTGEYGGTGPAQYIRGSREITESDILALGKLVGNAANDQTAGANARRQLQSIFENDPSFIRREQARDAMSYGLPGYPGGPAAMGTSTRTGGAGGMAGGIGDTADTAGAGAGGAGGAGVYTASDGTRFTDQAAFTAYTGLLQQQKATQGKLYEERRSAFQLLRNEFERYGLGELVGEVEALIKAGLPPAEFAIELRKTPTYQKRFQANPERIKAGLRAISEAEYISLEDQYQNVMRQYGLPTSYYEKNQFGKQANLDKFIAADVSPVELEERLQTGYKRVQDSNPEVLQALRAYYPNISNGDILAYVLDPKQAIQDINRKVTAAEIGGEAARAGLSQAAPERGITGVGVTDAEYLARYGVTKESARQGFGTIASGLERGRQLSEIYQQPDYTQAVAEAEVFSLPDAEQARRQRRKLGQLETATFGGTTGMTGGALGRERAGQY
jgi:hypothetical protein